GDPRHPVFVAEVEALRQELARAEPFHPGWRVAAAHAAIRRRIPFLDRDRALDADVAAAVELVADGTLLEAIGRWRQGGAGEPAAAPGLAGRAGGDADRVRRRRAVPAGLALDRPARGLAAVARDRLGLRVRGRDRGRDRQLEPVLPRR